MSTCHCSSLTRVRTKTYWRDNGRYQSLRKAATASQTQTVTSLGDNLYMLHLSEQTVLPQSMFVLQQPPLSVQYGPPSDLSEVPAILWAKHKNHVELIKSAPPQRVILKANAMLPTINQYHLPQKAI